eukprot:CAMPEP_0178392802 /NCGR_PEP_ID=MMETSP0689_2-20121128/11865_1 /TAXON_ID=160604 /ORGANISM="Amphidinium massartii, Strain CS-259" /LENGTH=425 /DNA_ID=CAMNT_0020013385 /DNA_START=50 /DNA_END=1327 /DNA_ORIENTATION=+
MILLWVSLLMSAVTLWDSVVPVEYASSSLAMSYAPSVASEQLPLPSSLSRRLQRTETYYKVRDPEFYQSSQQEENDAEVAAIMAAYYITVVGSVAFFNVVLPLIFSLLYYQGITSQRNSFLPRARDESAIEQAVHNGFRTPPFACFDNIEYCLYGWFCLIPRAADTAAAVGVWPFWQVVLIMTGVPMLAMIGSLLGFPGSTFISYLPWVFLMVVRSKVRAAIGLDGTLDPCDCLMWFCCQCCAAAQEAREVDMTTSSRVTCFCRLIKDDQSLAPLVGPAVEMHLAPAAVAAPAVPLVQHVVAGQVVQHQAVMSSPSGQQMVIMAQPQQLQPQAIVMTSAGPQPLMAVQAHLQPQVTDPARAVAAVAAAPVQQGQVVAVEAAAVHAEQPSATADAEQPSAPEPAALATSPESDAIASDAEKLTAES